MRNADPVSALGRREFIQGVLASSALLAAGDAWSGSGSSSGPIHPGGGPFDIAIVGAGMAGLSAAQTLLATGFKNFVVLEAQQRWGGRAYSINGFMKFPVDVGAEWFLFVTPNISGGPGTNNPLFDHAFDKGRGGSRLGMIPDLVPRVYYDGTQQVGLARSLAPSLTYIDLLDAIEKRGQLTSQDPETYPDVPASEPAHAFQGQAWFDFAVGALTSPHGPTLSQLGCLDLYNLSLLGDDSSPPSIENWLIRSGLGNFVATFADGVPLSLNTPVTSIGWGGRNGVQLATPAGTVQAKAVIVTVPMSLLRSGQPTFNPILPQEYLNAFAGLPTNHIEKVYLTFDRNIFGDDVVAHTLVSPFVDSRNILVMRARVWGENTAEVVLGTNEDPQTHPTTAELAKEGAHALIEYALGVVASHFPEAKRHFRAGVSSNWITGPYSRGAYTYAPPGSVLLRQFLSTPLNDQIFFAGEAVAVLPHSSVPGAYQTGKAAASLAMKALA